MYMGQGRGSQEAYQSELVAALIVVKSAGVSEALGTSFDKTQPRGVCVRPRNAD